MSTPNVKHFKNGKKKSEREKNNKYNRGLHTLGCDLKAGQLQIIQMVGRVVTSSRITQLYTNEELTQARFVRCFASMNI